MSRGSMCSRGRPSSTMRRRPAACRSHKPCLDGADMNAGNVGVLKGAMSLLAGTSLLAGCGARGPDTVAKLTAVHVQAAGSGPATAPIDTNGVVATKDEMRL